MHSRSKTQVAALAVLTALTLAGCGGNDTQQEAHDQATEGGHDTTAVPQNNYEFDIDPEVLDDVPFQFTGPLRIQIPEQLKKGAPEAAHAAVASFDVAGRPLDALDRCATDVTINWTSEEMKQAVVGSSSTPDEAFLERVADDDPEPVVVESAPSDDDITSAALADSGNVWVTSDFDHMTFVDECTETLDDRRGTRALGFDLQFPYDDPAAFDVEPYQGFAEVEIAPMRDGTSYITDSEVDGYVLDPQGQWTTG